MDDISTPRTAHAAREDLQYIRQTLAAAGHISTVPGKGLIAIGILAFAIALIDMQVSKGWLFLDGIGGTPAHEFQNESGAFVIVAASMAITASFVAWLLLLLISVAIGVWTMRAKARRMGQPAWTPVLRKAMWPYSAAMLFGGLLTFAALGTDGGKLIPPVWLGCYGVALVAAGGYSVAPVRWMGLCFLLAAAGAAITPASYGLTWLALGFGWVHIAFGAYIAWRHDG